MEQVGVGLPCQLPRTVLLLQAGGSKGEGERIRHRATSLNGFCAANKCRAGLPAAQDRSTADPPLRSKKKQRRGSDTGTPA